MRPARLALVTLLCLVLPACGGGDSELRRAKERVVVGVVGRLAGPDAEFGKGVGRGVAVAVSEYNAQQGSTYEAEVVSVETEATPEGATKAAETLVATERLLGAIGPFHAPDVVTLGSLLSEAEIPFLIPSVTSPEIPEGEWRGFRRLIANSHRQGAALADEAMKGSPAAMAILHDPGAAGTAFATGAREKFDAAAREVVRMDPLPGRGDLRQLATAVAAAQPGAVLFGGTGRGIQFVAALRAAGYAGPLFVSQELRAEEGSQDLGEGTIAGSAAADPADPRIGRFASRYRSRFGVPPEPFAVEAYEGALMLLEGAEEVEPKPREIVEFLRLNREFLGDSKSYRYEENGELREAPLWLYELRGGAWRYARRSDLEPRRRPR